MGSCCKSILEIVLKKRDIYSPGDQTQFSNSSGPVRSMHSPHVLGEEINRMNCRSVLEKTVGGGREEEPGHF